jgi:5-deoxy-glucuronate isomerase
MPDLRIRARHGNADGQIVDVTPASAGWRYVGFEAHRLVKGRSIDFAFAGREACVMILTGRANIVVGESCFQSVGERSSVFDEQPPGVVYVPAGCLTTVSALTDIEVAIASAPGTGEHKPRLITADRMSRETRGEGTNTRFVRNILPETEPAESLLIAEVVTPGGNWSSYPPHKHDNDMPPEETALEETYYYHINPVQGFAFQRVYTDDRSLDETVSVEDGDVVMVPRGYHPVAAPHGYDVYYLNVMAGPRRQWIFHNDPAHDWIVRKR